MNRVSSLNVLSIEHLIIMPRLTEKQAGTLFAMIEFANKNSGIIPTGKELAHKLQINERAASARRKRILDANPDDFIQDGRIRKIKYETFCNEPESAALLLLVNEGLDERGRILKAKVIELKNQLIPQKSVKYQNDDYIERIIGSGYLQKVSMNPNYFRLTDKFKKQFEYLKLLAEY